MRLVHTRTLQLQEFVKDIPPYAILSHTWGNEEVGCQDIQEVSRDPQSRESQATRRRKGFEKILRFCTQARLDDFDWAWVDTCCIDKTSSAELSEAINSMFKWYQHSSICFVYLVDVDPLPAGWHLDQTKWGPVNNSRWFTRGWTLQELIAPDAVAFFANDWSDLGSKLSLEPLLTKRTNVPTQVLRGLALTHCSAAERMSWAAERETTREEDTAYCLLGIFDVHIPLLYGEGGERAFLRLQEEIWRKNEDYMLLLWSAKDVPGDPIPTDNSNGKSQTGILARHPRYFKPSIPVFMNGVEPDFPEDRETGHIPSWREVHSTRPNDDILRGYLRNPQWFQGLQGLHGTTGEHAPLLPLEQHASGSVAPTITARGLSLFLPLSLWWMDRDLLLAWTYCRWYGCSVCIVLVVVEPSLKDTDDLKGDEMLTATRLAGEEIWIIPQEEMKDLEWFVRNIFLEIYPSRVPIRRALRADEHLEVTVQIETDYGESGVSAPPQLEMWGWHPSGARIRLASRGALFRSTSNLWTKWYGDLKAGLLLAIPTPDGQRRGNVASGGGVTKDNNGKVWVLVVVANHFAQGDEQEFGPRVCCLVRELPSSSEKQNQQPPVADREPGNACDGVQSDRSLFTLSSGITVVAAARRTERRVSHLSLRVSIIRQSR